MFSPQSISAADDASSLEGADDARGANGRAGRRVRALDRLADHGLELIEGLKREALATQAEGAAQPAASAEAIAERWAGYALTYARLSRAVRQSLALAAKLDVDAETRREQAAQAARAAAAAARAQAQAAGRRTAADSEREIKREEVVEIITPLLEDAVDALKDPARAERLYDGLHERLDDPDDTVGLMNQPLGVVVASICRDLGLDPDWEGWADEEWAKDEGEARAPGSPFMTMRVCDDSTDDELEPRALLRPSWIAAQKATGPP